MPLFEQRPAEPAEVASVALARDAQERVLVDAVKDGDEAAYEKLFRAYYTPICAFIAARVSSRDTARDLTHNIFTRLWTERARLDIRGSVRGYLYAAARFEAISNRRTQASAAAKSQFLQGLRMSPGGAGLQAGPEELLHRSELQLSLRTAVDSLPPRCREILILRWQHELTYLEIAQTLSISVKTVENQITIGFRALRALLRGHVSDLG